MRKLEVGGTAICAAFIQQRCSHFCISPHPASSCSTRQCAMVSWAELEMRRRTGRNNPEPGLGLGWWNRKTKTLRTKFERGRVNWAPEVIGRFKQADGLGYHCGSQLLSAAENPQTDALPFQFVCQDSTQCFMYCNALCRIKLFEGRAPHNTKHFSCTKC